MKNLFFLAALLIAGMANAQPQLLQQKQIDGGEFHSIVLCDDSTVWTFGRNNVGQLGNGTFQDTTFPIAIGIYDAISGAAGSNHCIILRGDSTVWVWGDNTFGQLGDGTNDSSNVPIQVAGLTDIVGVGAGWDHSLAVRSDGTVWAWGKNSTGQLGNNTIIDSNVPVQVIGITTAIDIAGGSGHSLAILSDSTLMSWGDNQYGQLGIGNIVNQLTPVPVPGLIEIVQVAASHHSLAKRGWPGNSIYAWGRNDYGQLGIGNTTQQNSPVAITTISCRDIAAGGYHSIFSKVGFVYTCGRNDNGQLGDGTTNPSDIPILIYNGFDSYSRLGGGMFHSLYNGSSGWLMDYVYSFGRNDYGQLGDSTITEQQTPVVNNISCVVGWLRAEIFDKTDNLCFDSCNGTATVTAWSGCMPYTYLWNTNATTKTATGLCAGNYGVTVIDSDGYWYDVDVTITGPPPLLDTIIGTNVICNGDSTGAADLTVTGGTPQYTFNWSNGDTTEDISILTAGTYIVTITDSCGTVLNDTIIITEPPPLTVNIGADTLLCLGDSYTIDAGAGYNSYLWHDNSANQTYLADTSEMVFIEVTDTNGCFGFDTVMVGLKDTVINGVILQSNNNPLQNARVYLIKFNPNDSSVWAIDTTYTDILGYYEFQNVLLDTVYIKAAPDSATYPTQMPTYFDTAITWQNSLAVPIDSCDTLTIDFSTRYGNNPGGSGFIGGLINQGAGKVGCTGTSAENIIVILIKSNGEPLWYDSTDVNGYFSFQNIPLDSYYVWIDKPFVDNNQAPVITIDAGNPIADSLLFKLHPTYLEYCEVVGIAYNTSNQKEIKIYPNPSEGKFTISSRQGAIKKVEVYDLFGRKVLESKEPEIDMSSYPAGLYIWSIGNTRGKLIIEH